MSSLVIAGDTSGSVTLQAPAVAGSTILTLPSTSGTIVTSASGTAGTATNLAGGSNGTIPYQSASGTTQMLAVGTAGQILQTNGAGAPSWVAAPSGGYTLGTPISPTSGTSIDFTGIPAGVKQIVITFSGIQTDGSSAKLIQIGDSGGIETSGYASCGYRLLNTTVAPGYASAGYAIYSESSGQTLRGSVILTLLSSSANTWVAQGVLTSSTASNMLISGDKSLSATLDRVRITTELGTQNFTAGSINIAYI